jgi:hypothetical protein
MRLLWVTAGTEGALALSSRRACFADCLPCRSAACHLSCLESTLSSTLEGIARVRTWSCSARVSDTSVRRFAGAARSMGARNHSCRTFRTAAQRRSTASARPSSAAAAFTSRSACRTARCTCDAGTIVSTRGCKCPGAQPWYRVTAFVLILVCSSCSVWQACKDIAHASKCIRKQVL